MKVALISLFILAEVKFLIDYFVKKMRQKENRV